MTGGAERPVVRPAREDDAPALSAVAREAFSRYLPRLGFEPPPMLQDFAADAQAGAVWTVGRPPQGYVVARGRGEDWLIENLARRPGAAPGLGRILLAFAEEEGRRRGFRQAVLYTHVAMREAAALYRRLGYVETGRTRSGELHRVHFAKPLIGD